MDNENHIQALASSEQPGVDQPSDEHRPNSFQAQPQRPYQPPQDGEARTPLLASVTPVVPDAGGNRCQADRCMADLSGLRRYFRRYHVCETHIRAEVVLIGGRQVRFCDQCSTFHPLAFFDGARRTCRDKLEQNRLKRKIRKAQNAGQQGAATAAALAAAAAAAASMGAAGGGTQQSDDVDSDDQPTNGKAVTEDAGPTSKVQVVRGSERKRPNGMMGQSTARLQSAEQYVAVPDVTRAAKVQRASAGQLGRPESQSPDAEDDEPDRRTPCPGTGGALREDAGWGPGEGMMEPGSGFGGGIGTTVAAVEGRDAGLNAVSRHCWPGDLFGGVAPEWPRVNRHDLRDQGQLQIGYGTGRDGAMYSPRNQPSQQGSQAQRSQPVKGQQLPLPPLPQQQQPLVTGDLEMETGGAIPPERLPQGTVQGTWRLHGGSMPSLPQAPPSPPRWSGGGEARATWPAIVVPTSSTPSDCKTLPDKSLRDGSSRFAAGLPTNGGGGYQLQIHQAPNNACASAPNTLGGSGSGLDGPVGRLGLGGQLIAHTDGAPAVTLLAQVLRADPELRQQLPRTSQTAPEPISPAKLTMHSGSGNGKADLLVGADGLTPAQQAALRLQLDAGLLASSPNVITTSQPPPQSVAGQPGPSVSKHWMPAQLYVNEQQLERQEAPRFGTSRPGAQGTTIWIGNGAPAQGAVWETSDGTQYGASNQLGSGPGLAPVAAYHAGGALRSQTVLDGRRMSAGSSVYTADEEEALALGLNEQDVSSLAREAVAVAAGTHSHMLPQHSIEEAPSLLDTPSFRDVIARDNADAQMWEARQRQLAEQQRLQKQQQVQFVLSIPNSNHQLMQGLHGEPRVTLLDHIQKQEGLFKQQPPPQQQPQLMEQHPLEQVRQVRHNPTNLGQLERWQQPEQPPTQARAQVQVAVQHNMFGKLCEEQRQAYPLSAFHMQGPVDDLDMDSEYLQLQSQHGRSIGVRAAAQDPGSQGMFTMVGRAPTASMAGGGSASASAPRAPSPAPPPHSWAGFNAGWRPANGDAGTGPASLRTQPQPQPPSPIGYVAQRHMQQLGDSLAGVAPSDQQLIFSTLMKFASHPPRAAVRASGQHRGPMCPPSMPPVSDVRDRGSDPAPSGGGRVHMLPQDSRIAQQQPYIQQQQQQHPAQSAHGELSARREAAIYSIKSNSPQGGTLQPGSDALQSMDSYTISDVLADRGSLQLLDSVLLAQLQDSPANACPAAGVADSGAAMQGGSPTPQPHVSDGLGSSPTGVGRGLGEGFRWVGSASDSQIVGRSLQQQGRGSGEHSNNERWGSAPGSGPVLRVCERPQQLQRLERSVSLSALLDGERRVEQQQQRPQQPHQQQQQQEQHAYRAQAWSEQQQGLGYGGRPQAPYGLPYDTNRASFIGSGSSESWGAGGQTLSHVALKLSHACPDNLPPELLERMQEAVRGGGAAVLPAAIREGCVEVLVEVMHYCPTSELCRKLFCLSEAENLCSDMKAAEAALSASEQLRAWVGSGVFDACERVTMQLLRGPVLELSSGSRPKLREWEAAMQHAGLGFAAHWPDVLMLHSGPPVLLADDIKAQQVRVYGPAELEGRLGFVQLCVRMAGAACSLGTVEAAVVPSEDGVRTAAAEWAAAGTGAEVWPQPPAAAATWSPPHRGSPSPSPYGSALRVPAAPAADLKVPSTGGMPPPRVHSRFFVCNGTNRFADVQGTHQRPSSQPREESPDGAAGIAAGPRPLHCSAIVEGSGAEADKEDASSAETLGPHLRFRNGAYASTPSTSRTVLETTEMLRSCFLTVPLPSSQPPSPPAAQQRRQQHQRHLEVAVAAAQQPEEQQQLRLHTVRSRSKSDDGCNQSGDQSRNTDGPPPGAPSAPPLVSISLNCQSSSPSHRRALQRVGFDGAASVAANMASEGNIRGLDTLPMRVSFGSTATLATAATLHDGLSCRSSFTQFTTSTSTALNDKMSLRSEWSYTSTSFGGVPGSADGAVCGVGGSGCSSGGALSFGAISRICEQPPLSGCSERTLRTRPYSGTSAVCGSGSNGHSPEGCRLPESGNEGYHLQASLPLSAFAAEAAGAATSSEARHALSPIGSQPSLKVVVPAQGSGDGQPDSDCDLSVVASWPVARPANSKLPPAAAAPAMQLCDGVADGNVCCCLGSYRMLEGLKSGLRLLQLQLPVLPRAGLALLEATGGHAVVACWPLLVVETAAQRDELVALWQELADGGQEDAWLGIATDLGLVLGNFPRRACVCESASPPSAAARQLLLSNADGGCASRQLAAPSAPVAADRRPDAAGARAQVSSPTFDSAESVPVVKDAAAGAALCSDGDGSSGHTAATLERTWRCGNKADLYCGSFYSVESWGTLSTNQQSAASEQAAHPGPVSRTVVWAASSSASSREEGSRSGLGSYSAGRVSNSSTCSGDREVGDTAAAAVGVDSGVQLAGAAAPASAAVADGTSMTAAGASAFSNCLVAAGSDAPNGSEAERGEDAEQPPALDRACMLPRGVEVSIALDLGSPSAGDAEDDPCVAAVTSFLAALRTAAGSNDSILGGVDHGGGDGGYAHQDGVGLGSTEGSADWAAQPTSALMNPATVAGHGHEQQQSSSLLPVQGPRIAGSVLSPPQLPLAAVGLSTEARAALLAAVSRLQRYVEKRRLPALWELLSRVEVEGGMEGRQSFLRRRHNT